MAATPPHGSQESEADAYMHHGYPRPETFRAFLEAYERTGVAAPPLQMRRQWCCIALVHANKVKRLVAAQFPVARTDLVNRLVVKRRRDTPTPRPTPPRTPTNKFSLGFVVCDFDGETEAEAFVERVESACGNDATLDAYATHAAALAATHSKLILYERAASQSHG